MAVTTFRIKVGDRWYAVQIGDPSRSPVDVTVEGETYSVEVEGLPPKAPPESRPRRQRPTDIAAPPPRPQAGTPPPSDDIVCSPMPGRVISVQVRPGDRVSRGDEVCVVEAMKMEQSIRATRDGVVKTVHVQPADPVKANGPLIELE